MSCAQVLYFLLVYTLYNAWCTEITADMYTTERFLDIEIKLPILVCHVRHTGYSEVKWYKDHVLLKSGSSDFSGHFLPLSSLLGTNSSSVAFDHPLKLQGYYWCETEKTDPSMIFDYLFRINEIHTYVGKFTSKDSLGHHEELPEEEKISMKKHVYEQEMQEILFGFLPSPNVHVTHMKELSDKLQTNRSLEVRFYLYVRQVFQPRKPTDNKLEADEQNMDHVLEYLNNDTSMVDPFLYEEILQWMEFRGIKARDIHLKSTLGCYEEQSVMSLDSSEEVTWPDTRIGDIAIPDNACSAKNGLDVARMCTGSFIRGATWGNPTGQCYKLPEGTTAELNDLYDAFGADDRADYIEKLVALTMQPSELDVTGLHITIEILKELTGLPKLRQQEISGMLSVIDKILEVNSTELNTAKNLIFLTSRILKVFDNILTSASKEEKEIQISKQHLLVDTKYTKTEAEEDHILGFAVVSPHEDRSLKNGSIEFVLSNSKLPLHDVIAYFSLPLDLVSDRESDLAFPCQVNMIFFNNWYLFQSPKEVLLKRHYNVVPTPVMYVSLSGGPAWNLTNPVQLYFKDTLEEKIENPVCVYYDPRLDEGTGAWSSEGCEYGGLKNGFHHCQCHHLSIFAVILSRRPDSPAKYRLGTSVYVGCAVSILALSFAVLLFILSKHWRLTVDHSILFCLAFTLLVCIILIFISEMHFLWNPSCMVLALTFHYTVFAILGWLLVQAVVYKLRFAKKTDVSEIPYFMLKAAFSVWGAPIIIVIVIWLCKDYSPPGKDNCWLTVSEVSLVSVIPVVVLMLVTLCINVCATYSLTCHFKKDFLVGDSHYNEPAIKFRVAFTIFLFFVLTWLFGFFALQKRTQELRVLFSICITLTSYYVTLFFIFQEISFWDLCSRCKRKEEAETPVVKYEARSSYNTMEDTMDTGK